MKKIHTTLAVPVLMAALLPLSACHKNEQKQTTEETPVIDVAQVVTDTVTLTKEYPGYLDAQCTVDLVARVDGYLTGQLYNGGDYVPAGAVLFTIESANYADAVRRAEAALADARATHSYAASNYAAMQKALQSNAVSQMEVLQSKSNVETAAANIASCEAALAEARKTLSYCTVRAPFAGHVSDGLYDVGAYLNGAASPVKLATIYQDGNVNAIFAISDDEYATIKANAARTSLSTDLRHIPIKFETEMPQTYTADLTYMAPAVDRSTGTMSVKAKINNAGGDLRAGMYCKIALPYEVDPNAILVKDASIGTDQSGSYIYVVNDSNRVENRAIKVGQVVADTMRGVTSGLRPGERYVTKALLKVRDGMSVKPRLVK